MGGHNFYHFLVIAEYYKTTYKNKWGHQMKLLLGDKYMYSKTLLLIMITLLISSSGILAQGTFSIRQSGNWNAATTWTLDSGTDTDGIPDSDDTANIDSSYTVTLTQNEACANLTINNVEAAGTAVVDLNTYTLTVASNVQILDGDLDDGAGGGTLEDGGNLTINTDGTFNTSLNGMSIDFNGTSGTQTVSGSYSGTLTMATFTKSAGSTLDWNLSITIELDGQLLLQAGVFEAGAATYTLNYGVTNGYCFDKSGGTFTAQTSTLNIVAGTNIRIRIDDNTSFYQIRHNPGVGRTLTLDESNAGSATFSITGQFDRANASSAINLLHEAAISYVGSAVLRYSLSDGAEDVSAEWPYTGRPSNVTFTSSVANNITMTLNRIIPAGGTLTLAQSGGNFIVADSTLMINGTLLRQTSGTTGISTSGTGTVDYAATGSYLQYQTTAATTIGAEWPSAAGNPPENVTINVSGNLSATNVSRTIRQDLTLSVGTIDLGSGTLTVLGTVVGSVASGGAVIADATTFVMGNSGSGTSYLQQIEGNLELNKFTVYKTGGSSEEANTVRLTVAAGLNFTTGGVLTITGGVLDLNSTGQFGGDPATLTIGNGGVLRTGGTSITSISSITVNGTLIMDGTSQETLPTGITIDSLEIDNTTGVITSSGTLTVGGDLTLTNGTITTNSTNILLLDSDATVTGTFGSTRMVIGPLRKDFTATGTFEYPIGSTSNYGPVVFGYTGSTSFGGTSTVEIEHSSSTFTPKSGPYPGNVSQIDNGGHYIMRERGTAPTGIEYQFQGTFDDGNFTPEDRNRVMIDSSDTYGIGGNNPSVNESANTAYGDGFDQFPDGPTYYIVFGAGGTDITWDGGGTGNSWLTAQNWDTDTTPTSTDNVIINGAVTVVIDAIDAAANTLTLGDGTNLATLEIQSDSLLISNSSASALLVRTNSKLIVSTDNAIDFDPTTGYAYDQTRTNFQPASIVEYTNTAADIPVDTYGNLIINGTDGTEGTGTITVASDLTKQNAQAFTAANAITVTGAFNQTAGNTDFASVALALNGNVNISAGTFTPSSTTTFTGANFQTSGSGVVSSSAGTITFSGGSAQTIDDNSSAALVFNDVVVDKSANNVTLNDPASVDGALTLTSGDIITTSTNLLTLTVNASVSAGSNNSHINGPLARNTNLASEYVFPVGDGTTWRRIGLIPVSTTAETYTAQFFNTDPQVAFSKDLNTGLEQVSRVSYWTVGRSGTVDAQVKLYWEEAIDGVNHSNLTSLRVARYEDDGPYWTSEGNSSTTTSGATSGTITSGAGGVSDFTSQGVFTLGSSVLGDHSLPVSLVLFEAKADFNSVNLSWKTESETNNDGFFIYRKEKQEQRESDWNLLNKTMINGKGNSSEGNTYNFVDDKVISGMVYEYLLESVSINGDRSEEKTIEVTIPVPAEFVLFNNYPNPFNPATNLKFQLPKDCNVSINVYNIQGELIKTLLKNAHYAPGEYIVQWNGNNRFGQKVASGVYIYRFTADNYSKIGRMILLK